MSLKFLINFGVADRSTLIFLIEFVDIIFFQHGNQIGKICPIYLLSFVVNKDRVGPMALRIMIY